MRRDALRLQDILQAAGVISRYLEGVRREEFLAGGLVQDGTLRQLIVVGEAAFKVSRTLQDATPEILG